MKPDRVDQDNYPEYLSNPHFSELKTIGEYLGKNWQSNPNIIDVKLVHSTPTRQPNTWTAIAVSFKKNIRQFDLIEEIVRLKADEFHGTIRGYYIFWWD